MAGEDEEPSGDDQQPDAAENRQDPYVQRMRPDPSDPARSVIAFSGLLGDSDRPGYRRLYLSKALNYYAEVRSIDIVHVDSIPPDVPPFEGLRATRITMERSAPIDYVWSGNSAELGDFDLDIRINPPSGMLTPLTYTMTPGPYTMTDCGQYGCGAYTQQATQCPGMTCPTCQTCNTQCGYTCNTCQTQCNQNTCNTCNQQTCHTCQTACEQHTCHPTCQTCETQCGFWCEIMNALNGPTSPVKCFPGPSPSRPPCAL